MRILFKGMTWTSLLLCIGAAVGLGWSYHRGWAVKIRTADSNLRGNRMKFFEAASMSGSLRFTVLSKRPFKGRLTGEGGEIFLYYDQKFSKAPRLDVWSWKDPKAEKSAFSSSAEQVSGNTGIYDRQTLTMPWSLVVGVLAIAPMVSRLRRRKSSEGNFCRVCGYDLRATPQRCPECGAEAPKEAV